jgi:DNA-binding transcriptional LysR family regulator
MSRWLAAVIFQVFRTKSNLPSSITSSARTSQTIQVTSHLALNLVEAVVAATAGAGIAGGFSYRVDDLAKSRSLVRLLEAYEPPPGPVSLIYPKPTSSTLKLRALLDFSILRLEATAGLQKYVA